MRQQHGQELSVLAAVAVPAVRCHVFSHCLAIGSGSGSYWSVCVKLTLVRQQEMHVHRRRGVFEPQHAVRLVHFDAMVGVQQPLERAGSGARQLVEQDKDAGPYVDHVAAEAFQPSRVRRGRLALGVVVAVRWSTQERASSRPSWRPTVADSAPVRPPGCC